VTRTGPRVSVVIPTTGRREMLHRTLLSLARQTYPADRFEVVVVDEGSIDGTQAMVAALALPYRLRYVRRTPRGAAAAWNAGVRAAAADLVIFLDGPTAVGRDFVAAHAAAHGRPRRVVQGPVIPVAALEKSPDAAPGLWDLVRARFGPGNMSVARMHVEEAGMFDEEVRDGAWAGLELLDRLQAMGLTVVKVSQAWGWLWLPPLSAADLDLLRERARRRGRAGIAYFRRQPTWRVRSRLGLFPPVFWLDRLLFPRDWPDAAGFRRWAARAEARRPRLVRFLVRLALHHAYVEGLREGLHGLGEGRPEARQVQREL